MSESSELRSRAARSSCFALLALLCVFGCESEREPATGGETHFLRRCSPSSELEPCGDGLVCLCSVCTVACSSQAACRAFPGAACVPADAAACGADSEPSYCDVACGSDAECAALSPAHRCEQGACRVTVCPGEGVPANQVLFIGDSFFAESHQITAYVEDLARGAGVLSAGERYRDHSSLRDNALALGGNGIAGQYAEAAAEARVRVVIMNGGGSDSLVGTCEVPVSGCALLASAARGATELFETFAADGVEHVVYAFYPDPLNPELREKIDALRPQIQAACAASPVPCHFLDLRPTFAGRYGEYVLPDGMNPTAPGARASAEAIWAVMRRECIAQ